MKASVSLLLLTDILLVACANQSIPATTPIATLAATSTLAQPTVIQPTATTRPTATPLQVHQWDAKPVVAEIFDIAGYTQPNYAWSLMPTVVVYADGRVLTIYDTGYNRQIPSIKQTYISTDELCSMLTRIESSGFFDFEQKDYPAPLQIFDAGATDIVVDAWRSNWIGAYALEELKPSDIPIALSKTFTELSSLSGLSNATPYQPDRIALLISRWRDKSQLQTWPSTLPSLSTLAPNLKSTDTKIVILAGKDAADAYLLFKGQNAQIFSEHGLLYQVTARPLLPLEIPDSIEAWQPSKFEDSPTTSLTCR